MEHEIFFTTVYMEHEIFFMIASALLLWIRIAWLGINETEYEKNDKNHLKIFLAHFWFFSWLDLCNSYKKETVYMKSLT